MYCFDKCIWVKLLYNRGLGLTWFGCSVVWVKRGVGVQWFGSNVVWAYRGLGVRWLGVQWFGVYTGWFWVQVWVESLSFCMSDQCFQWVVFGTRFG